MRTHSHKSRCSEQQTHIRLGYLMASLLNSRAVSIWPGWLFLLLGLAVADASYSQNTGGTTESSSLCSAIPETWTVNGGSPTGYGYDGFGADLSKPIGGWDKYYTERIVTEKESNGSTYTRVDDFDSLEAALERSGRRSITDTTIDTIFVVGSAKIKFSDTLTIPRNVTLASNRGQALSNVIGNHISDGFALGALLYIDEIVGGRNMLHVDGDNVRITGLRLRGPQREVHPWGEHHDWIGIRNGFKNTPSGNQNLEVDNCEIFQWPQNAVYVAHEGTACVRNNYIHHNQRWGRGYGVGLQGSARVSIEENLFAFNRHCVAGTGYPTQEYTARHNVVLASNNPPFDMHGLIEGGPGGWDYMNAGTPYSSCLNPGYLDVPGLPCEVGGNIIRIDHNTVTSVSNNHRPMDYAQPQRGPHDGGLGNGISSVYLRGIPLEEARVDSNNFADSCGYQSDACSPGALRQVYVRGGDRSRPTPVNFSENDNRFNRGWTQSDPKRIFFERFGDVFQVEEKTTIPADGHFSFSSDKWPYQWSANWDSRLSEHTSRLSEDVGYYGLEESLDKRTWRVENGKATTKPDENDENAPRGPIGEMRSKRFQINKNYVSFRIAGYMNKEEVGGVTSCDESDLKYANQVAMLRAHDDAVIFKKLSENP